MPSPDVQPPTALAGHELALVQRAAVRDHAMYLARDRDRGANAVAGLNTKLPRVVDYEIDMLFQDLGNLGRAEPLPVRLAPQEAATVHDALARTIQHGLKPKGHEYETPAEIRRHPSSRRLARMARIALVQTVFGGSPDALPSFDAFTPQRSAVTGVRGEAQSPVRRPDTEHVVSVPAARPLARRAPRHGYARPRFEPTPARR